MKEPGIKDVREKKVTRWSGRFFTSYEIDLKKSLVTTAFFMSGLYMVDRISSQGMTEASFWREL